MSKLWDILSKGAKKLIEEERKKEEEKTGGENGRKEKEIKKRGEREKFAFMIETEERTETEAFSFTDLKIFHKNCFGGSLKKEALNDKTVKITCERCGTVYEATREEVIDIIKTAIDGERRTAGSQYLDRLITERKTKT